MKKGRTPLFVPILWCITTAVWVVNLIVGLDPLLFSPGMTFLRVLCVLASLTAAAVNFYRWKKEKNE